jgi:hypothetical protein
MAFDLSMLNKNKYISSVVGLFLVLYGGLAKPKLPGFIRSMFENPVFRVVILALIMYRGNKDPQISLMLSVGFVMVMNQLNQEKIKEEFNDKFWEKKASVDKRIGFDLSIIAAAIGSILLAYLGNKFVFGGGEDDDE